MLCSYNVVKWCHSTVKPCNLVYFFKRTLIKFTLAKVSEYLIFCFSLILFPYEMGLLDVTTKYRHDASSHEELICIKHYWPQFKLCTPCFINHRHIQATKKRIWSTLVMKIKIRKKKPWLRTEGMEALLQKGVELNIVCFTFTWVNFYKDVVKINGFEYLPLR